MPLQDQQWQEPPWAAALLPTLVQPGVGCSFSHVHILISVVLTTLSANGAKRLVELWEFKERRELGVSELIPRESYLHTLLITLLMGSLYLSLSSPLPLPHLSPLIYRQGPRLVCRLGGGGCPISWEVHDLSLRPLAGQERGRRKHRQGPLPRGASDKALHAMYGKAGPPGGPHTLLS